MPEASPSAGWLWTARRSHLATGHVRSTGPRSAGHQGLAGAGVTGKLGTIKRSDGSLQATYDGYPFFTYIGGSAPGRASGNWVYLNGGLWYEVAVSRTSWLPRRPYGRSLGSGAHKREQRAVIMPWEAQVERA
jgi:hypothetical protein